MKLNDLRSQPFGTHQATVMTGERKARRRRLRTLGHCLAWLGLASQIRRERNSLLKLSDAQLKDIGVTRHDAYREAGRAYLDIPHNRLR